MEHAVYESEWYNRSESFKRMVQLVIARAQRPVSLTAGKLYTVSMETFGKVSNRMQIESINKQSVTYALLSITLCISENYDCGEEQIPRLFVFGRKIQNVVNFTDTRRKSESSSFPILSAVIKASGL